MHDTEHEIQTLFGRIYDSSLALKSAGKDSISLLTEAGRNEWADSLSSRLADSFALIGEMAGHATDDTISLRKILENSKYKDIFNFVKYGDWVKTQVLTPIEEILLLLTKNHDILTRTIVSLDSQIAGIPLQHEGVPTIGGGVVAPDPSLQKPLILQKERFEMQIESITRMIEILQSYQERLKVT
jgi:hypothetical protein